MHVLLGPMSMGEYQVSESRSVFSARRRRQVIIAAFMMGNTALSLGVIAVPAAAQTQTTSDYAIPAGPLASVLNRFADQSGTEIIYDGSLTEGRSSPGLSGRFTTVDALSRILAGTGLTYRQTGNRAFTLDRVPQVADGTIQLGTLRVEGASGSSGSRSGGADQAAGSPTEAPYRTAGSSNYITGEEIERFRGTSPADIFKGTPGVLSGETRNSGAIDVNIRGLQGFGRVPVSIDGAQPATSHSTRGYQGAAGRTYIDPDFIGGIRVDKGPVSNAASSTVGGAVSMSTISADDILLDGKSFGVRIRGGINSNSSTPPETFTEGGARRVINHSISPVPADYVPPSGVILEQRPINRPDLFEPTGGNGSIAIAGRGDNFEIVGAFSRRKNGNYHAGTKGRAATATYLETEESYDPGLYLPEFDIDFPSSYTWSSFYDTDIPLSGYRAGEEVFSTSQDSRSALLKGNITIADDHKIELGYTLYDSDFGASWPSQSVKFERLYQSDLSYVQVNTYNGRYSWRPEDSDIIDLKLNGWYSALTEDLEKGSFSSSSRTQSEIDQWGTDISNRSGFNIGLGRVELTYGASYIGSKIWKKYDYNMLIPGIAPDGTSKGSRSETGLFLSASWAPTEYLNIDAGLRYSFFHTKDETHNREHNSEGLAPTVKILVTPLPGIQLFGTYAEGYRAASLYEEQIGATRLQSNLDWVDVRPEHAKNFELGANVTRNGVLSENDNLKFKAAYFNNTTDDYIARGYEKIQYTPNYFWTLVSPKNIDYARFAGFEVSGSYDLGTIFVDGNINYYSDVRFCDAGVCRGSGASTADFAQNHVPPKFSASATLGARLFNQKLTLGGRLTHVGERATDLPEGEVPFTYPIEWDPYTLFDLFVSYKLNKNVALDLIADNITDRYYLDPLGLAVAPGPGRTIRGNVTLKF